jgi:glycine betaine/proline transport system ATP-binding protein
LFAQYDRIGIIDEKGRQIGQITVKQVISALARYSSVVS